VTIWVTSVLRPGRTRIKGGEEAEVSSARRTGAREIPKLTGNISRAGEALRRPSNAEVLKLGGVEKGSFTSSFRHSADREQTTGGGRSGGGRKGES